MQQVHSKRRYTGTKLDSVTYRKTVVLAFTDVSTVKLTRGTGLRVTWTTALFACSEIFVFGVCVAEDFI